MHESGSTAQLRAIVRFLYAIKDPLRLRLLTTLARRGEASVTELVHYLRVSQPLVSWHLARLRTAGLVQVERTGRAARYSVDLQKIDEGLTTVRVLLLDARYDCDERIADGEE
jgi:ArsR family transcriptional regulator